MWKRLQQKQVGRQHEGAASPTYENTLVEGIPYGGPQLIQPQSILTNANISTTASAARPMRPARPPREDFSPSPFQPPQAPRPPPQPRQQTESSVYSQRSPDPQISRLPRYNSAAKAYEEQVEISPPSSPETFAVDKRQRHNTYKSAANPHISPVDEMPDVSQLHLNQQPARPSSRATGATNIPVLRREKRRNQVATVAATFNPKRDGSYIGIENKKSSDTRWDTVTGEPTTSEQGKPPQVKPSEFTPPGNSIYDTAVDRGLGLRTTGALPPKSQRSFGERIKNLRESTLVPGDRPEWKGSSGRHQIVPPVADQPNLPPIDIPRKSSKRATSPRSVGFGANTPLSSILSVSAGTSTASPTTSGQETPTVEPIPGRHSPPQHVASPNSLADQPSVSASEVNASPVVQLPTEYTSDAIPPSPTTAPGNIPMGEYQKGDSLSSIERHFSEALKDLNFPTATRAEQPVSRFSVTTYATTTASTPRVSNELPSMPTPPKENTPVVDRRYPKPGSLDFTKATARKAVPNSPIFISMSSASRRNSKMLPKTPSESQSTDLVSSLQAQLDNLANRRANIQKSIRQMTELMPPDGLARGMEARRQAEEREKVALLKDDLADVVREEHDIGLRLHRALKRRDDNAVYEPTGLWVRRVTG